MKKLLVGLCPVDSGQMMFIDPCYVSDGFSYDDLIEQWRYDGSEEYAIPAPGGAGVVTSTGWGDGLYPVFAEIHNNRVARVTIEFMEEEEY